MANMSQQIHSTVRFDDQTRRLVERIAKALEETNKRSRTPAEELHIQQQEHHDERTLEKVRDALLDAGILPHQAIACLTEMQNVGILFRERR
jgi:hypothetical protein